MTDTKRPEKHPDDGGTGGTGGTGTPATPPSHKGRKIFMGLLIFALVATAVYYANG